MNTVMSSGDTAPAFRPIPVVPLWLLALFTLSGSLAMHIFVPALPIAAETFGATSSELQATIGIYIFGLAVGQLVYGPLSDRFGRRRTLMVGLAIYTLAGLGASLAPTVHALIVMRLFQALGGCSGLVLGRAIVRDTSGPTDSARRLALMNLMMTLGPGLAPIVGGVLASTLGWRWIFYMLTLLGACGLLLAWRRLPETGGRGRPSSVGELARNYRQLLGSRAFIGFSIGGGCATTSLYAYTASAPFIFEQQLGRTTHEVGVYLAILMLGISIGSFATSRLVMRIATPRLIVGANLLSLFASIVMLAGIASGHLSVPLMVGGMFVFSIGAGVASPAALTSAVSINPQVIGSASGLYGFTQMAVGGICTTLVGFGANPALAAAAVLTGAGVISQLMFWMALRVRPAATPSA